MNRLDRLDGLIGNLMRDLSRERVERAQLPPADPDTRRGTGSSVFSQFLAAERNRYRTESLSRAMVIKALFNMPQPQAQQQQHFFSRGSICRRLMRSQGSNFNPHTKSENKCQLSRIRSFLLIVSLGNKNIKGWSRV